MRKLYQLLAFASAVVSLLPLTSTVKGYFVKGTVFGSEVIFGHSLIQQIIETRVFPVAAIIFFVITWLILQTKKEKGLEAAKMFFSAGLGLFGFSCMRFIIFRGFEQNPIWADIWEEVTEFLFISAVFYVVFLIRGSERKKLLLVKK
jgi:hypothetical protein